mgnify:CR=1 FL=1
MPDQGVTLNARIQYKKDTDANWTSNNPVLLENELIIVEMENGECRLKIGDGTHPYVELPFISLGFSGVLGIEQGGTGATKKTQARTNLGAASVSVEKFTPLFGSDNSITDILNVNIFTTDGVENYNAVIRAENASTLLNCPISTTQPFYAYRVVYPISPLSGEQYNTIVVLYEMYPYPGRIWINTYNSNIQDWVGWRQVACVGSDAISNLIEFNVHNSSGESAIGTHYATGKFYLTSNTDTKLRQIYDTLRGPILRINNNNNVYFYTDYLNDYAPIIKNGSLRLQQDLWSGTLRIGQSITLSNVRKYAMLYYGFSASDLGMPVGLTGYLNGVIVPESNLGYVRFVDHQGYIGVVIEPANGGQDLKVTLYDGSDSVNAAIWNISGLCECAE